MAKHRFDFIDLFGGIGGMRIGIERAGGKCVFSSEWDKYCQETYNANFGVTPFGDINEVNIAKIPSHDLLVAGFPCQPFSQAGKRMGFLDTRGTLFFNIAEIAKSKKPKAILLENVKGLQSHDGGRTFETIINVLQELGYSTHHKVLNAKNFGLPQNRERLFIVALHNSLKTAKSYQFPVGKNLPTRVSDILDSRVPEKYTISDKLWLGHKVRKLKHQAKGNGFGYSLFDKKSSHTSTISARYYKDGSEILIDQVGKNPRRLTPREASRLQGFPEDFKIPVSDNQAYKQFGNSVAVPVIAAIANEISTVLKNG
jgi:DNA (cytosine-5)-methyltransferase 1